MNKIKNILLVLLLSIPVYANICNRATGSVGASICGGCGCNNECVCRYLSYTTFALRPQFQTGTVEYTTAFRDRMYAKENGHGGAFQVTLFGSKSTDEHALGTYFTPFCKSQLRVKYTNIYGEADIIAQHFNILTEDEQNFDSIISFCPKVSTFGIGLSYRQRLNKLDTDDPYKRYAWFEISAPITRIKTNMGLCEKILTSAQAHQVEGLNQRFFSCMTQAFNQCAWKYGKISPCPLCKWGLADITLKIGKEFVKCDKCLFDGYLGFIIPTGNSRTACYVFEPIIGHTKHFGILFGPSMRFEIWKYQEKKRKFELALDINTQYLFSKMEMRSFDLKCRPWSRYMEVYCSKEQALEAFEMMQNPAQWEQGILLSTPGINVFTKCVKVYPKLSYSAILAFIYKSEKFKIEAGYNFYAKQSECVDMKCRWNEGPAIKDAIGFGFTNSLRMIDKNFTAGTAVLPFSSPITIPSDPIVASADITKYDLNIITESDIDCNSVAHLGYVSHTLYLALGGQWDNRTYPPFVNFGASYEFGKENMILDRWTLWAKTGFSF